MPEKRLTIPRICEVFHFYKEGEMPEPISSTLTTAKFIGLLAVTAFFVMMSYIVVILFKLPKSPKQWALSIISTLTFSIGGGAATLIYFNLDYLVDIPHPFIGWCVIGFVFFAWGLTVWFLVRMMFLTISNSREKDLFEIGQQVRELIFGRNPYDYYDRRGDRRHSDYLDDKDIDDEINR